MKRKLFLNWKKSLITTALATMVVLNAKADCTIASDITLAALNTTYASCTGVMTIPSGVTVTIDGDGSLPSGVTDLVIANGGQLAFSGNYAFTLSQTQTLSIENTTITDPTNSLAAIHSTGPCNNNRSIWIGSLKYSACAGGGNVCLIFSNLIAQGGTLQVDPTVTVNGALVSGTTVCSSTPSHTNILLVAGISQNSSFTNAPSFQWSNVSAPVGASTPIITDPNNDSTAVITDLSGTYIFRVTVTQNLSTAGCASTENQIKQVDVPIDIRQSPTGTLTGGGTLIHNSSPTTSAKVDFTGASGTPEYTFVYTINDGANQTATSTSNVYSVTQLDTDPIGTYDYALVSVSDAYCTTNYTSSLASITIQAALPVKLVNFDVTLKNCVASISWESATEADFSYYQIEKSNDGTYFKSLDKVEGRGAYNQYAFTDKNLEEGKAFYRLKMVDKNGTFNYSNVKSITTTNCNGISIESTIVQNSITLQMKKVSGNIKIVDIDGKVVFSKNVNQLTEIISISQIPAGNYILNVNDGNKIVYTSKIIKL